MQIRHSLWNGVVLLRQGREYRRWCYILVDVTSMYMRRRVLHKKAGGSLVEVESGIKPKHSIMLKGRHVPLCHDRLAA